jgi:hypothetical protein
MATLKSIIDQNIYARPFVEKNGSTFQICNFDEEYCHMIGGAMFDIFEGGWEIVKPPLSDTKHDKIIKIDEKTQSKIFEGFTHNGHTFSLSQNAQQNWSALMTYLVAGKLVFPYNVTTYDDDEYTIQNVQEFETFINTAFYTVSYQIQYGRALKVAIRAATTHEQLDAIVDPR